ncbi:glycerol-3-phosphate 1-O-acyltransferase PlsY [Candidatus Neoehrlichia procyonis]|uniref:Glycerol-3-phosphate acyltransferase n=1 Tax=Candidatus Neoehrlichia procyonis str. RAC413 TaxID=1359163 RepID=A0A0F3NMU1_9RICK|nr:glycerol-3-phosphate 1-O-acyltransferase PlsY [Candidatus Neoehrlichia lotoris]KJV69375.1 acyl-phosphate glycerol 3-phosphate acyltransferase [Candidatus Neoehrlichia lotoris str. RAC413]
MIFIIMLSYIIGSIPFGLILSHIGGYGDIRKVGSQNIGATNVFRVNKGLAFLTLVLDSLKGFIVIFILSQYVNDKDFLFICSLFIVIGHIFPIWLKFKGGKGISSFIGVLSALEYNLSLSFVITWIIVFYFSRYSSLSSIIAVIISLLFVFLFYEGSNFIVHFLCSLFVILQHYDNIVRLVKGQENKIEFKL